MFKSLFRFMKLMGSRLPIYLTAVVFSTLGMGIRKVANSYLLKSIITAAQTRNTENIIPIVLGNFAVFLFGLFLWRTAIIRYNIEGRTAAGKVEKLVFSKAMRLPMSYYEQNHSSDFMSRLVFDTQKAADIYTSRLRRLLDAMILVVFYLVPMVYFSWELTLCLAALCLLDTAINLLFAKPLKAAGRRMSDANNKVLEKLTSILSGMELVKIFPVGARLSGEYDEASGEYFRVQKRANRLSAGTEGLGCLFDLTGPLAFLGLGIWFVSMGKIGLGELAALYSLYGSIRSSFWGIGMYLPQMMNCIANAEKIFEFLDLEEEPERWPLEPGPEGNGEAAVSIAGLSFSYGGGGRVLENFSMEVKRNSFTAVTGESGCGKSTLAKLLLGFYPPESGGISLNGRSCSELTLEEIRQQIAYVPQEPYLYETTIAENIAYGRYGAGREEIIAAAKAANAHEFISRLPNGYETVLGERGNTLSGGERQRIAIARAIIRNAPILLLDEATSALDNESETLVQQSIQALKGGRTIIMIAHRPSSIAAADSVVRVGR